MNLQEAFKQFYQAKVVSNPNFELMAPQSVMNPPGYASHRNVASGLYLIMAEAEHLLDESTPSLKRAMTSIAAVVMNSKVPVYYIQDSFARAVAATRMPGDLVGTDFYWPHQGFVVGLPETFIKDYVGFETPGYLFIANMPAGEHTVNWKPRPVTMVPTFDKFGFFIDRFYEGHGVTAHMGAYDASNLVKEAPTKDPYVDLMGVAGEELKSHQDVTERLGSFVIKLLTILHTNHDWLEEGKEISPEKRRNGVLIKRATWSPGWIGRKFKAERSREAAGPHASPKYHRREGHITHQYCGKVDENFVSASTIPRFPDKIVDGKVVEKGEFDWSQVPDETKQKFWSTHKRIWIPPLEVNA